MATITLLTQLSRCSARAIEDFELIISDNASTDDTADICRRYEKQDSRIRYFRQERNIGGAPNHNFLVEQARGELFKWASDDDLYARDLLKLCVDALDEFPDVVLGPFVDRGDRRLGHGHPGCPVWPGHGLAERTGAISQPAVRGRGGR